MFFIELIDPHLVICNLYGLNGLIIVLMAHHYDHGLAGKFHCHKDFIFDFGHQDMLPAVKAQCVFVCVCVYLYICVKIKGPSSASLDSHSN